jgi:hypothetical protein
VQPTTPESYRSISHILKDKGAEFHTFKPKEERNYRVVLKNMHYSINPDDIKSEIEKLGHKVENIWNIKQFQTKLPLSMFFVDLKPAPNNKDIFNVEFLQQCKIKFEPPKHKRENAQCSNCKYLTRTMSNTLDFISTAALPGTHTFLLNVHSLDSRSRRCTGYSDASPNSLSTTNSSSTK